MIYFLLVLLIIAIIILVIFFLVRSEMLLPKLSSDKENLYDNIDHWFKNLQKQGKFNGGVVIVKNDNVEFKNVYGYEDYERKRPLSFDSSFRLASVSKQFTATGILILVNKGIINVKDKVKTILPNFPYDQVSVENLLTHTSGIETDYITFIKKKRNSLKNSFLTNSELIELYCKAKTETSIEPGSKYSYNNLNYVILAHIIEIISKKSLEEFLHEELFEPLQMENSQVWNLASPEKTFKNQTDSFNNYLNSKPHLIKPTWLDGVSGDGAIFSSLNDLIKWHHFWLNDKILPQSLKERAFNQFLLNDQTLSSYGYGWVIEDGIAWHNGSWLGSRTYIEIDRRSNSMILVLDNSSSFNFDRIVNILKKQFDNEKI